jgi:hypothetical protein
VAPPPLGRCPTGLDREGPRAACLGFSLDTVVYTAMCAAVHHLVTATRCLVTPPFCPENRFSRELGWVVTATPMVVPLLPI